MATINHLPLEILLEILYELSIEELHRNKIVCKLWSSLISHPSFRSKYLVRKNSSSSSSIGPSLTLYLTFRDQAFLYYGEHLTYVAESMPWSRNSPKFSLNFLPEISGRKPCQIEFLGSSNGLLLCSKMYHPYECVYYVCNPVTKQWFTLIPSPASTQFGFGWGIVCYPSCESDNDSAKTQFKAVKIVSDSSTFLALEIFESATNQWRILTTTIPAQFMSSDTMVAKEHKGILYWGSENVPWLIVFDPNLDVCRQVALPRMSCNYGHSALGVSRDHLYYVLIEYSLCTNVWRYDDFEGERNWSFRRRFDLDWVDQHYFEGFHYSGGMICRLLAIDPMNCNVLYVSMGSRICSLDLDNKEMRELSSFPQYSSNPIQDLMFVHPAWPTSFSRLLPKS